MGNDDHPGKKFVEQVSKKENDMSTKYRVLLTAFSMEP